MIFHTPLHSVPPLGGPHRNIAIPFGVEKLEWWGYPMVKKTFEDMYNRLDTIPACAGRTDGQTDILPRHCPRYAYASRGKNDHFDHYLALIREMIQDRALVAMNH